MAPETICPFRIDLERGETMCFDPWFVRTVERGPRIVRDFCLGDFHNCPFYLIQGKRAVSA